MSDESKDKTQEPISEAEQGEAEKAAEGANPFEIPGLSIDPQEFMRDPMGAVFKIMSDPNAMAAVEQFMTSPAAQQMLSQGMNDPTMQRLLAQNPMLGGAFSQFGGSTFAPPPRRSEPQAAEPVQEELDEPRLPLLDPPRGGPAYPEQAQFDLDALLPELDAEGRALLRALAERRVQHHLGEKGIARLHSKQREPVDALLGQAAFAGELAWYAICELEEHIAFDHLAPLAKHALACVRHACAYRVPSFLTQLVHALADAELLSADDLRHACWALSAQPRDGVDGIFEIDEQHANELFSVLSEAELEPRLLAIFAVALLSWKEFEPSARRSTLLSLFENMGPSRLREMALVWSEWLGERIEIEGWRANQAPDELCVELAERCCSALGLDKVLEFARAWRCSPPAAAHEGLLRVLDVQWSDATAGPRDAYLEQLFDEAPVALRKLAFRVAAAWQPHEILARAELDTEPSIRTWAASERALVKY
ncbi:MAG: hypothetical protein RBU37_11225 [Myxococcota bacterium]|jgi:hypothetical protein|nr:hypothetical protein [Myxococcota bacterium]